MRTEIVTTLKRRATELLAELRKNKQPILITERGLPAAYLVDADSFDRQQQKISILEGIARGERAIEEGNVVSHAEAAKRLSKWLK